MVKLAEEDAGRANSVDSSSTAAGARGEPNPRLMDSAAGGISVAGLLPPLRQISLDVIQATVLGREKGLHRQPSERQNIFQDVFNEVGAAAAPRCSLLEAARQAVPTQLDGGLLRDVLCWGAARARQGGSRPRLCPPPSCAKPAAAAPVAPLHRIPAIPSSNHAESTIRPSRLLQLAGKDETAPLQGGQLYTLPSMQFLESMLSDFDRQVGAVAGSMRGADRLRCCKQKLTVGLSGAHPAVRLARPAGWCTNKPPTFPHPCPKQANGGAMCGPLDIPVDAFDLPESFGQSAGLRPTPFDQQQQQQQQQQQAMLMHQRAAVGYGAPHRDSTGTASTTGYSGFVPMGSAASAPVALGPLHNSGSLPLGGARAHSGYAPGQMAPVVVAPGAALDAHAQHYHLMALQQQQAAYQQQAVVQRQAQQRAAAAAALRGPAPPQPAQPRATPRRQSHAYADFEYEEAEVTVQTSKSGRVRKVGAGLGLWCGAGECGATVALLHVAFLASRISS